MQIRWSPDAADDLDRIVEFVIRENPSAARRIAETINACIMAAKEAI